MLDYQRKGYTQYGADMGRRSDLPYDTAATLTVRHVSLTDGYDPGGAYWGTPDNLYCASDEDGHVAYFRAEDAEAARAKFPRATFAPVTGEPSEADLAEMLDAYIEAALWSSTGDDDEPLDRDHTADDLAPEAREAMKKDVEAFARANAATIVSCFGFKRCDWSQAGHDFWLNRCGHGVGFWDGDWPEEQGKILDKACKATGEAYVYVGDDGKVHYH